MTIDRAWRIFQDVAGWFAVSVIIVAAIAAAVGMVWIIGLLIWSLGGWWAVLAAPFVALFIFGLWVMDQDVPEDRR